MFGASKLSKALKDLIVYIPFTRRNILSRSIDKSAKTLLDVGCGNGITMGFINKRKKFVAAGVDIHQPYLAQCKLRGIFTHLYCYDIRALPFGPKSFDVVLCLQVLEHLEREEGLKLLQRMEQIARKQVILDVPVGELPQWGFDNNPFQAHKSSWYPVDLKKMGYRIRGYDVVFTLARFLCRLPNGFKLSYYPSSLLVTPFVYFIPRLAGHMVCVKNLNFGGNS